MQLASISHSSTTGPRNAYANLQVVAAGPVVGGVQMIVQDSINFGFLPRHAVGATRVTSKIIDGVNRQSWYEMFRQSLQERDASDALGDAVDGSGLIALLKPAVKGDAGNPVAGHTRIYVDKRAQYLDFANDAVPAAAQAVLDAVAAYRALAA